MESVGLNLEKEMATHSSVLAWRIPGTGEPGGLLSMGSHRIGHDWSDLATGVKYMEKLLTLSVYYDHLYLSLILGASYAGKVLFHVITGNYKC